MSEMQKTNTNVLRPVPYVSDKCLPVLWKGCEMGMRDEDEMDLLEIAIQHHLERFNMIPEQTGCDPLLLAIFRDIFVYMKELRERVKV